MIPKTPQIWNSHSAENCYNQIGNQTDASRGSSAEADRPQGRGLSANDYGVRLPKRRKPQNRGRIREVRRVRSGRQESL